MDDELQHKLMNWEYAICDAAMRKHYASDLARAVRLSIFWRRRVSSNVACRMDNSYELSDVLAEVADAAAG